MKTRSKKEYFQTLDCARKTLNLLKEGKDAGYYLKKYEYGPDIPFKVLDAGIERAKKRKSIIENCLWDVACYGNIEVREFKKDDLPYSIITILSQNGVTDDDYCITDIKGDMVVIVEDFDSYDKIDDILGCLPVPVSTRDRVFYCEECNAYHYMDDGYMSNIRFIGDYGVACADCFRENLMEYLKDPLIEGIYTSKGKIVMGLHALEPDELPEDQEEFFEDCKTGIKTEYDVEKFNKTCDKEATYVVIREPVDMMFSDFYVYKVRG